MKMLAKPKQKLLFTAQVIAQLKFAQKGLDLGKSI